VAISRDGPDFLRLLSDHIHIWLLCGRPASLRSPCNAPGAGKHGRRAHRAARCQIEFQRHGIAIAAIAASIAASALGGYFTSWLGLKRALIPLIIIMNLPNAAYVYLSTALPSNFIAISVALCVEMFGYGFGFVGVTLLMMQEIAPGKYQAAHYAFANSLMNLGLIVPGAVSGYIQKWIGYQKFFVWVLIAAVPALVMARFIPIGNASAESQSTPVKALASEP